MVAAELFAIAGYPWIAVLLCLIGFSLVTEDEPPTRS